MLPVSAPPPSPLTPRPCPLLPLVHPWQYLVNSVLLVTALPFPPPPTGHLPSNLSSVHSTVLYCSLPFAAPGGSPAAPPRPAFQRLTAQGPPQPLLAPFLEAAWGLPLEQPQSPQVTVTVTGTARDSGVSCCTATAAAGSHSNSHSNSYR